MPKIPPESVDNVENPGREHVRPVDNHSCLVVRNAAALLESAAFHRTAIDDTIFEKPLVSSGILQALFVGSDCAVLGYPQSCQPFSGPSSGTDCLGTTANQFLTGLRTWKVPRRPWTTVTCMFDGCSVCMGGNVVHMCGKYCG